MGEYFAEMALKVPSGHLRLRNILGAPLLVSMLNNNSLCINPSPS